jgi:hypothetical protein
MLFYLDKLYRIKNQTAKIIVFIKVQEVER